jgi:ribosomal protein S6--L-glutamate ligase
MKIAILSMNRKLYSTRRLLEAARGQGHEARVVNTARCYMRIAPGENTVRSGEEVLSFDAVIPRVGASITFYGTAVVRQFEMAGVFSLNESQAIARSRDKLRSLQILAREGIRLPRTSIARDPDDSKGVLAAVGGPPVVVKLIEGTQGSGVVLAETRKAATSLIGAFQELNANFLVQEFIAEAGGADYRAFVVGGEVVAAMRRHAAEGEFRSNLHRGGSAEGVELTEEQRDTAVRAASALGLDVAGVDLLDSERGPLVLEVNSSPGLEGIEKYTGVDVAGRIVAFAEERFEGVPPEERTRDRIRQ